MKIIEVYMVFKFLQTRERVKFIEYFHHYARFGSSGCDSLIDSNGKMICLGLLMNKYIYYFQDYSIRWGVVFDYELSKIELENFIHNIKKQFVKMREDDDGFRSPESIDFEKKFKFDCNILSKQSFLINLTSIPYPISLNDASAYVFLKKCIPSSFSLISSSSFKDFIERNVYKLECYKKHTWVDGLVCITYNQYPSSEKTIYSEDSLNSNLDDTIGKNLSDLTELLKSKLNMDFKPYVHYIEFKKKLDILFESDKARLKDLSDSIFKDNYHIFQNVINELISIVKRYSGELYDDDIKKYLEDSIKSLDDTIKKKLCINKVKEIEKENIKKDFILFNNICKKFLK